MQLVLSNEEARLLIRHLDNEARHVDAELIHTDKHDLQRDLAQELRALRTLIERIRDSAARPEGAVPEAV